MKITDCHCHLDGTEKADDVFAWLKAVGVDRVCVLSRCPNREGAKATDYVEHAARLAQGGRGKIIPFAWLDPTWSGSIKLLHHAVEKLGIRGVKIIPDGWYPWDKRCLQLYKHVEQLNVPILFHSGILWSWGDTSRFCRPAEYEVLMEFTGIRFALAHISWPWTDECLAVAGKINHMRGSRGLARPQCYVDTTPGAPDPWRKPALQKMLGYISEDAILFGTDGTPLRAIAYTKGNVERDKRYYQELKVSRRTQEKILSQNFDTFLNG